MAQSRVRVSRDAMAALLAWQARLEAERGHRPSISAVIMHLDGRAEVQYESRPKPIRGL
jgi:hypothetical protein